MRSTRFGLLLSVLLFNLPVRAQQTQTATTSSPASKDPQAVSVLNQALTVAGGAAAITAVSDYTGAGNITYHSEQDAHGTVTVLGLRTTEFRMDANLPQGIRSRAVHEGVITTKAENGKISSTAQRSNVPSSDAFPFQTPLFPSSLAFPYRQLAAVVSNPIFSLSYKGVAQTDGHSVYDIELQRGPSGAASRRSRDIFIDTVSFQIVRVSDTLPKDVPHKVEYSDYRPVSGRHLDAFLDF